MTTISVAAACVIAMAAAQDEPRRWTCQEYETALLEAIERAPQIAEEGDEAELTALIALCGAHMTGTDTVVAPVSPEADWWMNGFPWEVTAAVECMSEEATASFASFAVSTLEDEELHASLEAWLFHAVTRTGRSSDEVLQLLKTRVVEHGSRPYHKAAFFEIGEPAVSTVVDLIREPAQPYSQRHSLLDLLERMNVPPDGLELATSELRVSSRRADWELGMRALEVARGADAEAFAVAKALRAVKGMRSSVLKDGVLSEEELDALLELSRNEDVRVRLGVLKCWQYSQERQESVLQRLKELKDRDPNPAVRALAQSLLPEAER